jgi:hypothetical protein
VFLDERRKTASQQSVHDQTVSLWGFTPWGPSEILQSELLLENLARSTPSVQGHTLAAGWRAHGCFESLTLERDTCIALPESYIK